MLNKGVDPCLACIPCLGLTLCTPSTPACFCLSIKRIRESGLKREIRPCILSAGRGLMAYPAKLVFCIFAFLHLYYLLKREIRPCIQPAGREHTLPNYMSSSHLHHINLCLRPAPVILTLSSDLSVIKPLCHYFQCHQLHCHRCINVVKPSWPHSHTNCSNESTKIDGGGQ